MAQIYRVQVWDENGNYVTRDDKRLADRGITLQYAHSWTKPSIEKALMAIAEMMVSCPEFGHWRLEAIRQVVPAQNPHSFTNGFGNTGVNIPEGGK